MILRDVIFFFVLFGIIGISAEIFVSAILEFIKTKNKKFLGHSSPWMFFVYGSAYFIILFGTTYLMNLNIFIRALIYMFIFYLMEFVSGSILKKFNAIPWDYSNFKYNFKGIITLEFAPLWFFGGIILEALYFYLKPLIF